MHGLLCLFVRARNNTVIKNILLVIESAAIVAAVVFALLWIFSSTGSYGPIVTLCFALTALCSEEFKQRYKQKHTNTEIQATEKENNASKSETIDTIYSSQLPQKQENSTVFFSTRFAHTFPGVRGIAWYKNKDAVLRLKQLFEPPIVFAYKGGKQIPIWWWRDGNMHISAFKMIDKKTVLMDYMELRIAKIAAVQYTEYYRSFVYIECNPMEESGVYLWDKQKIGHYVSEYGYAWEEYGLYNGKYKIKRTEYDDGAAVIKGKLVRLNGKAEIRTRYITPYNIVIAPHGSPINNNDFDSTLVSIMNGILKNTSNINVLASEVQKLPKRATYS